MNGVIARLVALAVGIVVALVLAEAALQFLPSLIPPPVLASLPGRGLYLQPLVFDQPIELGYHYRPRLNQSVNFTPDDPTVLGERQALDVAPRDEPRTLRVPLETDADGFMNRPIRDVIYPIVVTGDDFLAPSADTHWLSWLTTHTGSRARNLGMPGWGPQAEVAALRIFGMSDQPKDVVLAFSEGDDLADALEYETRRASGLSWKAYDLRDSGSLDRLLLPVVGAWYAGEIGRSWRANPDQVFRYPLNATIAGRSLALVFADAAVGRLTTPRAEIEASRNFALTADALRQARDLAAQNGARFTLVYLPSKERVYLPLLREQPELVDRALQGVFTVGLGPDGTLGPSATPADAETLFTHLDDQFVALAAFAAAEQIPLVDLTPAFREAATRGETLYNFADRRWNAEGHKLAAKVLGEHLKGGG